jgi:Na+-transporting NADH:ubiquinone oxidoreductase subunit F
LIKLLLYNSLIISSISLFLSLLISVIDKIVNNYGEIKIDINSGSKTLKVKGGSPLLFSLSDNKIFIPSACGGKGSCAMCKVKVKSDIGPLLPTETGYMNDQEKKDGIRLSCQIKVKKDLSIELPEHLFNVKEYICKVKSIKDLTSKIKEIKLEIPENNEIKFTSGQYIQLEAPAYEKIKSGTQRAYSIASSPNNNNYIELIIGYVPNGIVTTYVFKYLKEGDNIKIVGPFGEFNRKHTENDMICVAGGTGMAPIRSIIFDMIENNIMNRNIWYFFGAGTLSDLYYINAFQEIEKKHSNFKFIPSLSNPDQNNNWKGETGLVTETLEKYLKNKISKESIKEGYLCGSPGMIDACIKVMTNNGIPEDKIYYDKFA